MGDPVSITGLVLAIPPIVESLISYYGDAKNAKSDIQRYTTDLFSLKGIFEYIESVRTIKSQNGSCKYESPDFALLLKASAETLLSIQSSLETKRSSFSHAMQQVTWSHKKKEIQGHFERMERLKSGILTVMMGDSL